LTFTKWNTIIKVPYGRTKKNNIEQGAEKMTITEQLEKQLDKYPVALDPTQVGEILGVSRRYVDQLLDDGKIPYFVLDDTKQYKQKRVLRANLIAYMIQQNQNTIKQGVNDNE
jgi:hypothetical protein